jgi:DsbC/DsbD-like thiol-disulfide interchange protein
MKRRAFAACAVFALTVTASTLVHARLGGRSQGVQDPITWALAVQPAGATVSPGGTVTLALTATIEDGWHLYSIKLEPGGPVPTAISVPDGQVFSAGGEIGEPVPLSSFDGNFNKVLEYHEGKAVFTIPVKAAATAPAGKQTARVAASYQTCNERLCLPPRQVTATAEVQVVAKTDVRPPAPPVPPDRDAFNKALSIKELGPQLDAILKYVADFPDSETVYFAVARGMRNIGDADGADLTRLTTFVRAAESTMDAAAAAGRARRYQQADLYYNIAYRLMNRSVLIGDALRMAQKSVPRLDKAEFMAKERATHNERQAYYATKTPGRVAEPFPAAESEEKWTGIRASHLSALGRALLASGRRAEAEAALKESYALTPVLETGIALATIAEKDGRIQDALNFAVAAELTGKMTTERAYLETLYRKTHNDSLDGLTALLDNTFSARHLNPITTTKYVASPRRTSRTVLAEMFTGAACIPCLSVDLSFERVLERYSRADVAYLVYHIHAPSSDPYSNFAVEDRSHFYGVNSAPTVIIDGHPATVGEGSTPLATTVFPKIDAALAARLDIEAGGAITASAVRQGSRVSVAVNASARATSSDKVKLHIALVEMTSSYSGENGLRFQPMVVRAMYRARNDRGAWLPGPSAAPVTWAVDLAELAAENNEYYDWYIADLKKRANIDTSFREKRSQLDPSRLAIVAFLQDDVTHAVLQSSFTPIK